MLDGRQVAVLAALTAGDAFAADSLLTETAAGEPWEQAVSACLTVLCRRALGRSVADHVANLVDIYLQREVEPGMTVFDIRLGLTILDLAGPAEKSAARRVVQHLHQRTIDTGDGYAARECLANPLFSELADGRQRQRCGDLVQDCALGSGALPENLRAVLSEALRTSDRVIRGSVASRASAEKSFR